MSTRRSLSDASDASADDDEFLNAAFDELEAEEQEALVRGGFLRDSDASSTASSPPAAAGPRRSGATGGGARRSNAARMLEALEALSHEADAEGAGVPQSLRGLLEQLQGAGGDGSVLGGMFPFSQLLGVPGGGGAGNARFQRLLTQLAADQPVHAQMEALSELCETLSMSSEEALAVSGFSVDAFVPAVATLIRLPSSMDVLLLAARALSTILELFPGAGVQKAAAEQVIPSLCEKLLEIEYMDVAELSLQILERIVCKAEGSSSSSNNNNNTSNSSSTPGLSAAQLCAQYRTEVIQENGLVALLQFVDFFPLEIQRRAARIVCQLCTDFPLSLEGKMRQGLPYISNLLRSFDNEILQSSFACLQMLAESTAFSENAEFASMVATEEICGLLLTKLTSYASLEGSAGSSASSQLSPTGYTSMLRFLSCLLSCVPSDMSASSVIATASHLRFVKLPPIVTALLAKPEVISENQLLRETLKLIIVVLPIAEELTSMDVIPPEMLALAHAILPLIIKVYDVTSRADLRYDCLGVILRSCSLMHASQQPFTAQERSELSRLAAFLARVLRPKRNNSTATSVSALVKAEKDFVPVQLALRIIEVPLQHPGAQEAAKDVFERHGVASIIRFYASSPKQDDAAESDLQEVQTTSARLVREYFGDDSSIVSVMAQLEGLVEELQRTLTPTSSTETEQSSSLLQALLKLRDFVAQGDDFLTAHEIACSGLVKVLIQILSSDEGQQDFAQMLEAQGEESDGASFVTALLRCLQDAISSEKDAFSVSATDAASADIGLSSGSVATDLDQLTQHIKVHVLIEEAKPAAEPDNEDQSTQQADSREEQEAEEAPLRWMKKTSSKRNGSSYKSNKSTVHDTVVLVEPLARIETMEDFIADKLFGRGGTAESILDELTSAGAEGEEAAEDESGEFANDVVKPRRVVATYKGQALPPDMSIVEAIVKFGGVKANAERGDAATATSSSSRSRIWTASPHDITFRVAASSSDDAADWESDSKIAAASTAASDAAVSVVTGQWWDDVWDLLLLLKLVRTQCIGKSFGAPLSFVNSYLSLQVRRALQQPVRVVTNSLPEWCFRLVNEFAFVLEFETRCHFMYATTCGCSRAIQYLCRSVWRKAVLEEPAPVHQTRPSTSGGRRRYRDGSSRTRTSGLDNISQMVKLPRLKVRVARSRLLQSAMKLVAIYGGKKAVIEIEFLGEVGTGLGPTTEFFTLVCQQIQAKQLQLWRDDDAASETIDMEQKREAVGGDADGPKTAQAKSSLPIRGYHRVAVYHCSKCKALHIPSCSVHRQLLAHEKKVADKETTSGSDSDVTEAKNKSGSSSKSPARRKVSRNSVPQCAQCLDDHDWHSAATACECKHEEVDGKTETAAGCTLKWWILSDEEVQYLAKVFPRHTKKVNHPVLQCAHCDTVNFPGTDAGIVVMDGDRMVSRSGRRMFERDYRAVTKHVSPLCEGTPLNVMTSAITRSDVDMLVENLAQSPEVLESEVESLNYLSEAALAGGNVGGGPPVTAPFGLYPKLYLSDQVLEEAKSSCESSDSSSLEADASSLSGDEVDVLTWFRFLGRFVGQAMLDERLLNLPFARPFLRALRGEKMVGAGVSVEKSLSFVEELDPAVANSLRYLHDLATKYAAASVKSTSAEVAAWTEEVDSLCLSFTMVGADEIPLEAGGEDVSVTLDSLHRYVTLNLEFLLDRTIKSQVQAFRQGFEQICGGDRQLFRFLQAFEVRELEALLSDRGAGSTMWDRDGVDLREHMVCDHGYTADSRAIANLVSILCELTVEEQRLFVRFVTGANRLPLGGLRSLEPKLTVVRKLTEAGDSELNDAVLPSASTCTNYLKLPDYSTREIMKQRLLFCIHEGQCSFHLS